MPPTKTARNYLVIVDDKTCEFPTRPDAEAEYDRLLKAGTAVDRIQLCEVRVLREARAGLAEVIKRRAPRKARVAVTA